MEGVNKNYGKEKEFEIKSHFFTHTNVIQLHVHTELQQGGMYLEENSLIFEISGKLSVNHGMSEEQAGENQMIFLKKEILINYRIEPTDSTSM